MAWVRVAAALFAIGYGANQFSPLMVLYREQGHYSATVVAAFFAVYAGGLVPGLLLGGPCSDRFGRRRVLLPGVVASVPASAVLAGGAVAEPLLYTGRFLFGLVTGIAMAVGTTWVKELSQPPHDARADEGSGARRAALSLSAGFGSGPAIGGALAQWAPLPMELPYVVHILLTIPVLVALAGAPETVPRQRGRSSIRQDLRIPATGHPRFRALVVPAAPWVFGAASISFAVQPAALGARTGGSGLIFATLLTTLTLSAGVAIQTVARRLDRRSPLAGARVGLALVVLGVLLAAGTAWAGSLLLAVCAALVLGCGYGISLVSGLLEVQRVAAPEHLAGLTAVFYSLTYVGFLLPVALAALTAFAPYPVLLGGVAALAATSLLAVVAGGRRLRARPPRSPGRSGVPSPSPR